MEKIFNKILCFIGIHDFEPWLSKIHWKCTRCDKRYNFMDKYFN